MQVVGCCCVCRSESGRMGRMKRERAGICGVERERVDTALCGADRRVDTRAEREHTFYRRVWRANWLPFALSKAPNSHTNTLLRTNIEAERAVLCRVCAPAYSHAPGLSLFSTQRHRNPHVQNPTESLAPGHALHPSLPQPTKALSFNPLLSRTRTSSGGAYVQAKWSTHSLLHFTTPPFTPSYPPNPTR